MDIAVKVDSADFSYQVLFAAPTFNLIKEDERLTLVKHLTRSFNLRLNDIKFFNEGISNKYMAFSKFYGTSWFDVSYGFEEVNAIIRKPLNIDQVKDFCTKLFESFKIEPVTYQRLSLQLQLATEDNSVEYLKSLNPYTPAGLEKYIFNRGVSFQLNIPEHQLFIYFALAPSIHIKGGLFLSIDTEFRPNQYDFMRAFSISEDFFNIISNELNITLIGR